MAGYYCYQNLRNPHKYICLTVYPSYHYYIKQCIIYENGVVYWTGTRRNRPRQSRVNVGTLVEILDDYNLIGSLSYKGRKAKHQ